MENFESRSYPKIDEKRVYQLEGMRFVVPSYQRGYRWDPRQIRELLTDIYEFNDNNHTESYCLQPVVVKEANEDGLYEVIDGQQRLTTIFIILKYAYRRFPEDNRSFSIAYETRRDSEAFLQQHIDESESLEDCANPDYFYMRQAWNTIHGWFAERGLSAAAALSFAAKLERDVMLIWYEVSASEDVISMFRKLNMGKIPLTNAELVKGLLFSNLKTEASGRNQIELSDEWDRLERSLQDDEFWYFLTGGGKVDLSNSTRIDLLFDIWAEGVSGAIRPADPLFSFVVASNALKGGHGEGWTVERIWDSVLDIHSNFQHWFADDVLYHKIGYLIMSGSLQAGHLLRSLDRRGKSEIDDLLDGYIKESLSNISSLEGVRNLEYGRSADNRKIKNLLLLFNVQTILDAKDGSIRFPFHLFKKQMWELEHIHATASVPPADNEYATPEAAAVARQDYFKALISVAQDWGIDSVEAKLSIDDFLNSGKYISEKDSREFFSEKCEGLFSRISGSQDALSNLTLLDKGTNACYGSKAFASKREVIKERDRSAVFIPVCTKNVFMKYYTESPGGFQLWNRADRDAYLDGEYGICKTLSRYLKEEDDE